MLAATIAGMVQCRFCRRGARLDLLSRWIFSCVIAMVLWMVLLYAGLFYSGHLFLISIVIIAGGWGMLCWLAFPVVALEEVPGTPLDRKQSAMILVLLVIAAILFDGFMASRFETDDAPENPRSPSAVSRDR